MVESQEASRLVDARGDPAGGVHALPPVLRLPAASPAPGEGEFTTREAASILQCNVRSLRRAIERGELPAAKRGTTYYIAANDLWRYSTRRSTLPAARPSARLLAFSEPHALPPALPRRLSSFVGRVPDVAAVVASLGDPAVRLLTLTGPGGIGKTRLALAVAEAALAQFPDGVVVVELAAVTRPHHVLSAICRALGLREVAGRDPRAQLHAHLRAKRMLLVVDNLEHVLDAAPDISAIAAHAAGVTVLATSRAPLRVAGEHEYPVAPLPLPAEPVTAATLLASDAARLFVTRARAHDPTFQIPEASAPVLAGICARLDGLPLAIELAAARVKLLSLDQLHRELDRRLPLLAGGSRDAPRRHRTMRDAIAWSYDLLPEDEQRLFRRLAVFTGGFGLDAAEWLWAVPPAVVPAPAPGREPAREALDVLAALVDKNLAVAGDADAPEPRFTLLETVREFAQEQLAASGEEAAMAAELLAFLADLAERAEPHLLGPDEQRWFARFTAELGNLRAALAWGMQFDQVAALRLAAALWGYWFWAGLSAEAWHWFTRMELAQAALPPAVHARALTTAAAMGFASGERAQAAAWAARAVTMLQQTPRPLDEARAQFICALSLASQGELAAARDAVDLSLARFAGAASTADRSWAAYVTALHGTLSYLLGDAAQSRASYEAALALGRSAGSAYIVTMIVPEYAVILSGLGDRARARQIVREALAPQHHAGSAMAIGCLLGAYVVANADAPPAQLATQLGAVEAFLHAAAGRPSPDLGTAIERVTTHTRERLAPARFAAAWEAGRRDPDAVVASILAGADPAR